MKVSVNLKYIFIQGLFWMIYCVATGFTSLYLLGEGVSNASIGMITASFCIISAILQPILGRICDNSERVSWKGTIIGCGFLELIICVLMSFISGKIVSGLFIGALILLANLCMPFVNSALFYYTNNGEHINFGIARGIGSGSYAVLALIIGNLAIVFGTKTVPVIGIGIVILFILTAYSMPYDVKLDNSVANDKENKKEGIAAFVKKYPSFFVMLIGFTLLATTHNTTTTYLLQIIQSVGGGSENLGLAIAIQASLEIPMLFLFDKIIKKVSATSLMVFAAFGYVIKASLFYLAGSVNAIYFVGITQIISFAIFASASVYYTGEVISKEDRTTGQSFMTCIITIGTVLGNLIGGWVLDLSGIRSMLTVNILIGVAGLVTVLISYKLKNTSKEN